MGLMSRGFINSEGGSVRVGLLICLARVLYYRNLGDEICGDYFPGAYSSEVAANRTNWPFGCGKVSSRPYQAKLAPPRQ